MLRAIMLSIYREKIKSYVTFNDDEWNVFIDFLEIKELKKK